MQILGETTGKVIIWANYIHDIETNKLKAISEEYGSRFLLHLLWCHTSR
jgi:hypothetical protein